MNWLTDSTWMNNPNVRLFLAVVIAGIVAAQAVDTMTWKAWLGVIAGMFVTAKAFMSDPNQAKVAEENSERSKTLD